MGVVQSTFAQVRWLLAVILVASASLALTACTDKRGGPIPYDTGTFRAPDPTTVAPLEAGYRIAPMDTLAIKVFRMEDLSGEFEVDLMGNIALPLIGDVAAADKTPEELDRLLTSKYSQKYLQNPDISVAIKSSARRNLTIDGAVKNAGAYPVNGPMSLMQAVALAGGLTEDANARRVAVFRQIEGRRQAAAFDLLSIRRGQEADPPVYSGDIVVVDGSQVKETQKRLLNALPILSIFRPF